jgi:hypothetical protein
MRFTRIASLLFSIAASSSTVGHAQSPTEPGDRPPPHRPPPAAFDACKGKNAGDACSVTFREHTMTGTCATTPDAELACRPDRPPPGPPPDRQP